MRAPGPLFATLGRAAARFLPGLLCPPLQAAHRELRRSLQLGFSLAETHQQAVRVVPAPVTAPGHLPLRLPEGVRWGRPASVPLPPDLAGSGWRAGRPRPLTLLPQRRAAANVWFLHHGRETLCLCLDLRGQAAFLRYRPRLGAWTEA